MEKIQARLDDPNGEYPIAEAEFSALNAKLKDTKSNIAKLLKDGQEAEAKALEATLPAIMGDWQLAKDRFDIAIRQKKASQQAMDGLMERIANEQQLLDRLEGKKPPAPAEKTDPKQVPATPGPANASPTNPAPAPKAIEPVAPAVAEPPAPVAALPGFPAAALPNAAPATTDTPASTATVPPLELPDDPVVRLAREKLELRRAEARDADEKARLAESRVRAMENSIANAKKILLLERESAAQIGKTVAHYTETLGTNPPADDRAREDLIERRGDAEKRLVESNDRAQRMLDRIAGMNETLSGLKTELEIATGELEDRRGRVSEVETEIAELVSPIAPRNLFRWIIKKGPRLLLILGGMLAVHFFARQFSRHIVRFITRNSDRGSVDDRENRANTLVGVFRYVAGLVIFGGGFLMLLDEAGVPVVPLMGGAAVIGLAVAFGAQNLIRDYFTGFMMLMEDQYSVNDVVRIGTIAGLVEQISLRMTVLRDLEGVRHFVPHGTVTSVSNLTHGWSRALMEIPVAYKENVDRVIDVLMQLGHEIRLDPELGNHILDVPEMLGVDELANSGVVIKFLLKTRPLKQWPIKRELLRRIKNRFDELGIEIPFPHQTVYHHFPNSRDRAATLRFEHAQTA